MPTGQTLFLGQVDDKLIKGREGQVPAFGMEVFRPNDGSLRMVSVQDIYGSLNQLRRMRSGPFFAGFFDALQVHLSRSTKSAVELCCLLEGLAHLLEIMDLDVVFFDIVRKFVVGD